MAGAALVHSVWLTTPAENQKLARHPSTKGVGFKVVPGWADPEEPVMKDRPLCQSLSSSFAAAA
jgi:hypothetical protein